MCSELILDLMAITSQNEAGENLEALKTIRIIDYRLQGREAEDDGDGFSVDGQVDQLIHDAVSEHNLSKVQGYFLQSVACLPCNFSSL